jgi:hypothetical protein
MERCYDVGYDTRNSPIYGGGRGCCWWQKGSRPAKGEQRVQFADARVLHAVRRALICGICSATGSVASKYDREESAFGELKT